MTGSLKFLNEVTERVHALMSDGSDLPAIIDVIEDEYAIMFNDRARLEVFVKFVWASERIHNGITDT